ncbi:ATP-dependent DNA helicase RecG family protein [Oribacterium sp. oral taxon 078 str. F0262]|uniref:putative ATP-dependent DNA helicase RecG n=1 Tax=Oribacterium sp. oral taxon 078 TaxID=652706 RepID=UPI0001BCB888|nr:putative ATP-dependent DNA helicase RecG [Oribacterium sp. oral taxon 078]EFE91586.1 ATP-dependent DNA helicase RecG family protein [Oribacterium sp. oral taxon 078 str. F0262]
MELQLLKGVGPKTEEIFRRLGIHSAEELLFYFPTDYLLYPPLRAVSELREGEREAVYASLLGDARLFRGNGLVTLTVSAGDLSGRLFLRWFHSPFLKKKTSRGRELRLLRESLPLSGKAFHGAAEAFFEGGV